MRMPGAVRLRRAARWAGRGFRPGALILMYHRIADLPSDPCRLAVTPAHFGEHLDVLRRRANPITLADLHGALRDGDVPPRAVVVTSDDGYLDNLTNGRPLLARHDVSATVFVASGYVDRDRELWWDELERLLLQPGALPATLCLGMDGDAFRADLGTAARYDEEAYRRHRRWSLWQRDDPTERHRLYRELYARLHAASEEARRALLDRLAAWAGVAPSARPTHRVVSRGELRALGDGGLVEIGAHTVNHPSLAALAPAEQRREIRRSKADLEEALGRPVTAFAYPHGSFAAETPGLVREAGFARACSSVHDSVWRDADPFRLPRVVVDDLDGDAFARRLDRWFRGQ